MQAAQAKILLGVCLRLRHLHPHLEICEARADGSASCAEGKGNFPFFASASSYIHFCFYCSCVCVSACVCSECEHIFSFHKIRHQIVSVLQAMFSSKVFVQKKCKVDKIKLIRRGNIILRCYVHSERNSIEIM